MGRGARSAYAMSSPNHTREYVTQLSLPGGEEPEAERAPDAREAVDRDGTDRIVDSPPLEQVDRQRDHHPGDGADEQRTRGRDPVTGAGDRDEATEEPVHRDAEVPFL